MSYGIEFEKRCLQFEQSVPMTHYRHVTFKKMYDKDGNKVGVRMQKRRLYPLRENAPDEPLVEVFLDGTIIDYGVRRWLQYSAARDIKTYVENVALLVHDIRDPNSYSSILIYRRKPMPNTQIPLDDLSNDFGDFMHANLLGDMPRAWRVE